MTLTRHENGAGATPTCGRRRRRGGGGAQLYRILFVSRTPTNVADKASCAAGPQIWNSDICMRDNVIALFLLISVVTVPQPPGHRPEWMPMRSRSGMSGICRIRNSPHLLRISRAIVLISPTWRVPLRIGRPLHTMYASPIVSTCHVHMTKFTRNEGKCRHVQMHKQEQCHRKTDRQTYTAKEDRGYIKTNKTTKHTRNLFFSCFRFYSFISFSFHDLY